MELHPSLESVLNWLELPTEAADGDSEPAMCVDIGAQGRQPAATKLTSPKPTQNAPPSELELQMKWRSHYQLQHFLESERFPRAIALVEGLAQRLPHDLEVRQWQASTYQRWGRQLMNENQLGKARIYLKKALKTDPHNRTLWSEVERDFRYLEQIFSTVL